MAALIGKMVSKGITVVDSDAIVQKYLEVRHNDPLCSLRHLKNAVAARGSDYSISFRKITTLLEQSVAGNH